MGLNFPNVPTVGQQWPVPPVAGIPVYQWDGEKWAAGPPALPDGLVHYDIVQTLVSAQMLQARSNIGVTAIGSSAVGQIVGTTGTTQPAAGFIGERVTSTGNTIASLTSGVTARLSLLSIPSAGIWDLEALTGFGGPGATSSSDWITVLSTLDASQSGGIAIIHNRRSAAADVSENHVIPRQRYVASGPVSLYLNAQATFTVSTYQCNGSCWATRVS